MKTIDLAETLQWLELHRVTHRHPGEGPDGHVFAPESSLGPFFKVPERASSVLFLARELSNWLPETEVLLWITYWNTYPPEEYEYFNEWRHQHNEHRKLVDAPGYLFNLSDRHDRWILSRVIFLLMALNWQGFVVQPAGPNIIWLADEIVEISTSHATTRDQLAERFELLGIERVERE